MYVDELYKQLEESGYQNGIIKKSELHLSKYTDFSKQFDYMKNVDAQCLSSAKMDFNDAIKKFNTEYDKTNTYRDKCHTLQAQYLLSYRYIAVAENQNFLDAKV